MKDTTLQLLDIKYQSITKLQDYSRRPVIEGVKIINLKMFNDEGGDFTELCRIEEGCLESFPEFTVKQMNYSTIMPKAIKAFHVHLHQDDIWYVPPASRILVGLKDLRKNSPTKELIMRLVLGAHTSKLLYIPHGIAHGTANVWNQPATLIYMVNQIFTPEDELRLPFDLLGKDFWKLRKE